MKSSMKFTFNGFHILSNSERKNFDGSPSSFSKDDVKLDSISVDTEVEYSVEEMLAVLANGGVFIKELPNLITACVLAFKTALAVDTKPPTSEVNNAETNETEKMPEASETSQ